MINIQRFGGRGASSSIGTNRGWSSLKRTYKNNLTTDGIHQIQINGEQARNLINSLEVGHYNDTTQDELNDKPIALITYVNGEPYMNIYENKKSLMSSVKNEYGGWSQLGDSKRTIMSMDKEYYLVRDTYAKGGWVWRDTNNEDVKGRTRTIHKWEKK